MECLCFCVCLSITSSGVRNFFASGGHCNNTRDTQEHILLTGFMKKMQYNVLNIKTVAKHVGFYFIRGTTRPGYAGTITNLQIVLNTQKIPT